MPAGSDYVRDERRRIANVIAAIPMADLWTELRLRDGSADGAAAVRTDSRTTFRALGAGRHIRESEEDVHRAFQVRLVAGPRTLGEGAFSNSEQDVVVEFDVFVGYDVGGGDAVAGDWDQIEEVAAQDAERVRQELLHPVNRTAGGATGVTADRTVRVTIPSIVYEPQPDRGRLLSVIHVVSELRVTTEAA